MQVNHRSRVRKNKVMTSRISHHPAFSHQLRLADFKELLLPHRSSYLGSETTHIMVSVYAENRDAHAEKEYPQGTQKEPESPLEGNNGAREVSQRKKPSFWHSWL